MLASLNRKTKSKENYKNSINQIDTIKNMKNKNIPDVTFKQ